MLPRALFLRRLRPVRMATPRAAASAPAAPTVTRGPLERELGTLEKTIRLLSDQAQKALRTLEEPVPSPQEFVQVRSVTHPASIRLGREPPREPIPGQSCHVTKGAGLLEEMRGVGDDRELARTTQAGLGVAVEG